MEGRIIALFSLSVVGTAIALLLIVFDVVKTVKLAAWSGNIGVVVQGIVVLMLIAAAAKLIGAASP